MDAPTVAGPVAVVGADVGGTFTDVVVVIDGVVGTDKLLTTNPQSLAIEAAVTTVERDVVALVHGTTVATNALLERRGARTALITDAGFEDVIEIGRQDRPSLYDSFSDRPVPLVARSDRHGVGHTDRVPDVGDVEAVAISLIDGHRDPASEQRIAAAIADRHPTVPISVSSVVAPEFREYERTSTTVLNAYLTPATRGYLVDLDERLLGSGLASAVSVMRSSGGLMALGEAAALPVAVLLSGPAGGVVAARHVVAQLGVGSAISFDMGGTSTDVCLIDEGEADVSFERAIDGYACRMPSVGIHTVGAGGGSIAWIDPGGALRVGPQSAGADPGPACYGQGGAEATVTDAHVALGRVDPQAMLGGSVAVDADAANAAVDRIASQLGIDRIGTALGIVRIAEEVMAGAVRSVSIDRGVDPAAAHLIAFGGAGGLHATSLARSLGMAGAVIPAHAGVFSALGLLLAPPRADAAISVLVRGDDLTAVEVAATDLTDRTRTAVVAAGSEPERTEILLDVRYMGQAHEIAVPWAPGDPHATVVEAFEAAHRRRNGFVRHGDPIEIVAVRAATTGHPAIAPESLTITAPVAADARSRTVVDGAGARVEARVVPRSSLAPGAIVRGPAVIEEDEATTWLAADEAARVAGDGSLVVSW